MELEKMLNKYRIEILRANRNIDETMTHEEILVASTNERASRESLLLAFRKLKEEGE